MNVDIIQQVMSSINTQVLYVFTCRLSGFQRTFLSRAGVELKVFWGLFFSVRMTPHGSSLKALTRFFSCQPTCGEQTHETKVMLVTFSLYWVAFLIIGMVRVFRMFIKYYFKMAEYMQLFMNIQYVDYALAKYVSHENSQFLSGRWEFSKFDGFCWAPVSLSYQEKQ